MAEAAARLLDAPPLGKLKAATYLFDDPERIDWYYIPRPRNGLPIEIISAAWRSLVFGPLKNGPSNEEFMKATTIIALNDVLIVDEDGTGPVRGPELSFFTLLGTPIDHGKWGWRAEGNHLSLNYTLENGVITSTSPSFFGSQLSTDSRGIKS